LSRRESKKGVEDEEMHGERKREKGRIESRAGGWGI